MLRVRSRRALGFIKRCLPANQPPAGPNWLHEIKHDGFHNRWAASLAAPAVTRVADEDFPRRLPAPVDSRQPTAKSMASARRN